MRTDYSVTVEEVSKDLTHKQKVQLQDTTSCLRLDKETQQGPVLIDPDYYAILNIHNEKADDKDYKTFVIVDKSGQRYSTGSAAFWASFNDIMDEMAGSDEEFQIRVYRSPSKNRPGKDFITCEIV